MTKSPYKLGHFDSLTNNLKFLSYRAYDITKKFVNLAHHQEVCLEHAITNYFVATSTVPILQEALRCAKLLPEDKVCQQLIKYLTKHIAEETDHDVWFLNDLETLGLNRDYVQNKMPPANIAAMVGSIYYWIRHNHPVAILGYLACLEINHPTVDFVESLIEKSKLPAEGFSTFMEHAQIDINHKQDIIDLINNLPLSEENYRTIEMSAFQTYRYVALVMEDVCRVASDKKLAAM